MGKTNILPDMEKGLGKMTISARVFLRLALAVLFVLVLSAAMFQDRLLYFPDEAGVAEMAGGGLQPWPSPGDFRGLLAEPAGAARATVVVFHGNAGHAGHRRFYAEELTRLGLRVILAEYPGYGPRAGALGEESLVADAERTLLLAHERYGAPLLVVGESLGAGVAAAAGARQRQRIAGLWLITPWDRLENVAAHHYPWLPIRLFLSDRYDSAAHLSAFGRPVLVTVAERDDIVPARFGTALYEALGKPRRLTVIPGAGHNDWVDYIEAGAWRESIDFLLGAPSGR